MIEVFKDIKGFEGHYQVSTLGRIKSFKRGATILKPFICKKGYMHIDLLLMGKRNTSIVHRLVAKTFIPNPENKPEVNHINEIKHDNRLINLNWMTRLENIHHGTGLFRLAQGQLKAVNQYTMDNVLVKEWESAKEAHSFGFDNGNVSRCCNNKKKQYKGFIWRFR